MSHLTKVEVAEFNDEAALREALDKLGLPITENLDARWYSGREKCDFGVRFDAETLKKLGLRSGSGYTDRDAYDDHYDDHYDVGFRRRDNGTFEVVCDSEQHRERTFRGMKSASYKFLGDKFDALKEEYSAARLSAIYRRKGWSVQRVEGRDAEGALRLRVSH